MIFEHHNELTMRRVNLDLAGLSWILVLFALDFTNSWLGFQHW